MHVSWHVWTRREGTGWVAEVDEVVAGDGASATVESVHISELFASERLAQRAGEDWLARYQAALESRWSPC